MLTIFCQAIETIVCVLLLVFSMNVEYTFVVQYTLIISTRRRNIILHIVPSFREWSCALNSSPGALHFVRLYWTIARGEALQYHTTIKLGIRVSFPTRSPCSVRRRCMQSKLVFCRNLLMLNIVLQLLIVSYCVFVCTGLKTFPSHCVTAKTVTFERVFQSYRLTVCLQIALSIKIICWVKAI